jgi:hypothetical protein
MYAESRSEIYEFAGERLCGVPRLWALREWSCGFEKCEQ